MADNTEGKHNGEDFADKASLDGSSGAGDSVAALPCKRLTNHQKGIDSASGPSPGNITTLFEGRKDPLLQLNGSSEDSPTVTPNDSGNEIGTTDHNSQRSYAGGDIKVVGGGHAIADPSVDNASARLDLLQEAATPDPVEELAMIRNMITARNELDGFLAQLAAAKDDNLNEALSDGFSFTSVPVSLQRLAERFGPALVDPSALRQRSRRRVRVVTAAGFRTGVMKRVFAREPLLPSEVEADEDENSRQPGSSLPRIGVDNLVPLIDSVPLRNASDAMETSPEEWVRTPFMREVSAAMWCEEDEEEEAGKELGVNNQDDRGLPNLFKKQRLRFTVQTLSDRVLDDEEEDSDFGEEESETDTSEDETADKDPDDAIPAMARRLRPGRGGTKEDKQKIKANMSGENELEHYLSRRRKEELALVLKRIRAAIRVMDGAMPDDEVRSVSKQVVRIAAKTAIASEAVTTASVRRILWGLGDKTCLQRHRHKDMGGMTIRWVTVYVGVRRWERDYYGPGFAVETQDRYRLGWASSSQAPGTAAARKLCSDSPQSKKRKLRFGGRLLGLGWRNSTRHEEAQGNDGVYDWVGSVTCDYCVGHALRVKGCRHGSSPTQSIFSRRSAEFSTSGSDKREGRQTDQDNSETFFQARENSLTSPNDDANATEEGSVGILGLLSLDPAPPEATAAQTSVVPPSSWSGQTVEDSIWGAGHVCLRLRPDKLAGERDRDSPEGRSAGDGGAGFGSEADEGPRGSGSSDAGLRGDSAAIVTDPPSPTSGAVKSSRVPLSSITKTFGGKGRVPTDSCGVSSEPSSKSSEVFLWGDNSSGCLGLPNETMAALFPRVMEPYGLLPGERVVSVSCSERHSVLVTSLGSVYTSGEGTDGALGLGGHESSEAFCLVEWFVQQMPPPKLCQSSAGSGLIGCHSAAVDVNGRLYTWGVGAAAGHLSVKPILLPREVEALGGYGTGRDARDVHGRPANFHSRVKGVSCGGGFTLAVTHGGKVYAWGSWARGRLGLGRPPERTSRGRKKVPRFQTTPRRVSGFGGATVVQVAAGAWHGMALTDNGEVYTWGYNASGQLGFLVLPQPSSSQTFYYPLKSGSTTGAAKTSLLGMLRSSWTPVKLPYFGNASASLPTDTPRVSVGGSSSEVNPALVGGNLLSARNNGGDLIRVVHIACGPEHSIAVDAGGAAWTWGAEGRACLGHGEVGYGAPGVGAVVGAEAQVREMGLTAVGREHRLPPPPTPSLHQQQQEQSRQSFVPLSREREISLARAGRALISGWAEPRRIASLTSYPTPTLSKASSIKNEGVRIADHNDEGVIKIVAAALGSSHTALVSADGRLWLFGEGAAIAGGDVTRFDDVRGSGDGAGVLKESGGLLRRSQADKSGPDPVTALSAVAGPTPVPREVCASWFSNVAARRVAAVACGGQHVIAVFAGDHIGYSLGLGLFRGAMGAERHATHGREDNSTKTPAESNDDDNECWENRKDCREARAKGSCTEVKGGGDGCWGTENCGVDCELLVAGSYLPAHRVVLARRSHILEAMIAQEIRPGEDGRESGAPLQLLLPDLRFDVARALLEFLYTGELRRPFDLSSPLPYDLCVAAKSYGVPRLEALCIEVISLGADPMRKGEWDWAAPPPTLATDFSGALRSIECADVKFLAGGRPIYAHRAVLSCRSEYFSAMFRFRDQMATIGTKRGILGEGSLAEIVVPDSYAGFVRLLLFLYTGVLPEGSTISVLEDLVAADRYRLLDMKRVCQSMVRLSAGNCLQVLRVSKEVGAPLLQESALFFVEHHLSQMSQQAAFQETVRGSPDLAEVLLSRLRVTATIASALSSATARQKRLHDRRQQQQQRSEAENARGGKSVRGYNNADEEDEDLSFRPNSPFPWGAAGVAVVCGVIYSRFSNMIAVGVVVPIVNSIFFVGLAIFAFNKLKAKGLVGNAGRKRGYRRRFLGVNRGRGGASRNGGNYLFG